MYVTGTGNCTGTASFGWWGLDPLYAADLPGELYYRLVFVNGCKSATGAGWAFANKFGAKAYVGWGEAWAPSSPAAVIFANAFFSALKGHKTVQEAVNAGIKAFDGDPEQPFVASSITILRGANTVVDLSPE
ncbi:MAG: hypothetical protein NTX87_20110 [Planctomycetota bacterium]|nr:hypothetical protein [Planctomycetota bacterium]